MRTPGDFHINLSDKKEVESRIRAILIHRRFPGSCLGHTKHLVAMHSVPHYSTELEKQVQEYSKEVRNYEDFNIIRNNEDQLAG